MTRFRLGTYSLFLAIILWGVLLGAIVYSHIVYFPPYLSALPDSSIVVNGKYGLNEGQFWTMIHPLLILSLIITLTLNWRFKQRRNLIMTSCGVYFIVLIVSFLYFIPELGAFRQSPAMNISAEEWLIRSNRWQHLSWIRGIICFAAFVPLLVGLTKSAEALKQPLTAVD